MSEDGMDRRVVIDLEYIDPNEPPPWSEGSRQKSAAAFKFVRELLAEANAEFARGLKLKPNKRRFK